MLYIVAGVMCGALTAIVADSKGYSFGRWLTLGFLFNAFALIAAAGLGDKKAHDLLDQLLKK